jgi:hypothetical protein
MKKEHKNIAPKYGISLGEKAEKVVISSIVSSKLIYNRGLTPIVLKNNKDGKIVLHPKKTIRLNNKEAEYFINKYNEIIEIEGKK